MENKNNSAGRPKKFSTVAELEKKINYYFKEKENAKKKILNIKTGKEYTIKEQAPIHITGLCDYLGISNETLNQYEKKEGFSEPITRAKLKCEAYLVDQCICGNKGNKADFVLKNNYSDRWKEKVDVNNTGDIGVTLQDRALSEVDALIRQVITQTENGDVPNTGKG